VEEELYGTIGALLASTEPDEILEGLEIVSGQVPALGEAESRRLFELVYPLFYIDPLDLPGHVPVLEEAIAVVAGFGQWVIPVLIQSLEPAMSRPKWPLLQTLGRMGADAIAPLIAE